MAGLHSDYVCKTINTPRDCIEFEAMASKIVKLEFAIAAALFAVERGHYDYVEEILVDVTYGAQ